GLPGVRLGWVVGPDEVVERLWARTDYTTIAPPSVSDALARIALSPRVRPRILERTQAIIRRNLALVTSWIDASGGLFTFTPPDAGAISMIRYHADIGSLELAERMRVQQSLLIVPGAHFGIDSTMRLGFGPPPEELLAGLERLRAGFAREPGPLRAMA
ncbi:MAG: aminotransferase class I/II-fold pyridoxal phosphate-dependent enzyme, partial [Gemmatimonadetes bacterium]|nr:aminotransferase class I/II-fold pyridoxal phosphate-dependent enzyme [Gemmatimonadota bacterium]